jgi:hypothetical protein
VDRRVSARRDEAPGRAGRRLDLAALLYVAALAVALLIPIGHGGADSFLEIDRLMAGRVGRRDAAINVAVFVPVGFLVHAAIRRRGAGPVLAAGATLLAGGLLSAGAEAVQYVIPGRHSSATDVAFNLAGLVAGAVLHHVLAAVGVMTGARR